MPSYLAHAYRRFFSTGLFELRAEGFDGTYQIHKGLFESKIGVQITGFKEHQENRYTFQETTPTTVLKFIEWAYKDDYVIEKATVYGNTDAVESDKSSEAPDDCNEILCHAQVYIFADVYHIMPLKDLAFTKMTSIIKTEWTLPKSALSRPREDCLRPSNQLMPVLALCYADKLPEEDRLLEWLGQFAACRIEDLRAHEEFIAVMRQMLPYVVKHLQSSVPPPWQHESCATPVSGDVVSPYFEKPTKSGPSRARSSSDESLEEEFLRQLRSTAMIRPSVSGRRLR